MTGLTMQRVLLSYLTFGAVFAAGGHAEPFDLEALNCGGKYTVIRGANVGKSIDCGFTTLNTDFFSGLRDGLMICVDGCFEAKADTAEGELLLVYELHEGPSTSTVVSVWSVDGDVVRHDVLLSEGSERNFVAVVEGESVDTLAGPTRVGDEGSAGWRWISTRR